jgi:hypothetical protein
MAKIKFKCVNCSLAGGMTLDTRPLRMTVKFWIDNVVKAKVELVHSAVASKCDKGAFQVSVLYDVPIKEKV